MAKPIAKLVALLTPKRRWAQFSLATMLFAVTATCVWCGAISAQWRHCNQQAAAIQALNLVNAPDTAAVAPLWLRRLYGEGSFENVVSLSLIRGHCSDDDLPALAELTELRRLVLSEPWPFVHSQGRITDAVLKHLTGMKKLRTLDVRGTEVTEYGIAELQKVLPNCTIIR